VIIGHIVVMGHGAVSNCHKSGSHVLIGMNSHLLPDAEIGDYCIIAAGCLVRENMKIPDRSFLVGLPGEIKGEVSADRQWWINRIGGHHTNFLTPPCCFFVPISGLFLLQIKAGHEVRRKSEILRFGAAGRFGRSKTVFSCSWYSPTIGSSSFALSARDLSTRKKHPGRKFLPHEWLGRRAVRLPVQRRCPLRKR